MYAKANLALEQIVHISVDDILFGSWENTQVSQEEDTSFFSNLLDDS